MTQHPAAGMQGAGEISQTHSRCNQARAGFSQWPADPTGDAGQQSYADRTQQRILLEAAQPACPSTTASQEGSSPAPLLGIILLVQTFLQVILFEIIPTSIGITLIAISIGFLRPAIPELGVILVSQGLRGRVAQQGVNKFLSGFVHHATNRSRDTFPQAPQSVPPAIVSGEQDAELMHGLSVSKMKAHGSPFRDMDVAS